MKLEQFPEDIRPFLLPDHQADLRYQCLGCQKTFDIQTLLYTCPECRQVLLINDQNFDQLKKISGSKWRKIFDYRKMLNLSSLKGIFRFHEFIAPVIPLDSIVYLGEGHTPIIEANSHLKNKLKLKFFFKNDGQNPSASFKDRGMASALSYLNYLILHKSLENVLAICASTGDTSASAALYASYLRQHIKSAVLLPHKKVTPQQLSQPLGSGATVFEMPGVFDDCMKVVEALSEKYNVALLNSKNAWRILGQESYSYEIAQDLEYQLKNIVVILPIGNAGNITAVISGFLKFFKTGIIDSLPKIIGVQSEHADPVYQYYLEPDQEKRQFNPVTVKPSVAQAAMIGNPVSMPRVVHIVRQYNQIAGQQKIHFVNVKEQDIMDWQLCANRNGHIACTHGGECLAGLKKALDNKIIDNNEIAILDSTAHALKFSGFQGMYFQQSFPPEFKISSNPKYINKPHYTCPDQLLHIPIPGKKMQAEKFSHFIDIISEEIASILKLRHKNEN